MKYLAKLCAVSLVPLLLAVPARAADVVINEIMYHPSSENVLEEYIELFNKSTNPVNLDGWRLSRGVDYTFGNVVMPPGSYLVVAANLAAFQSKYPGVANVVGDWAGVLRNGGEEIELENASGNAEDSVTYANEGNWGVRRRGPLLSGYRGWIWWAEHDGLGKSLELTQPDLPNQHGQNWASSIPVNGTPGVVNSVRVANAAPFILNGNHSPAIPRSSDPVIITAEIRDEQAAGFSAALFYRDHSTTSPGSFVSTNMFDDGLHGDGLAGDGVFGAILPARGDRTVMEFYIRATDSANNSRTWPAPAAVAADQTGAPTQTANALYQVDDSVYTGGQPVYRLILTESERIEFRDINRNSDAQMNTTLVSMDPSGTEIRYLCGIRVRGAGSRGGTPHNSRLNLPNDNLWYGVSEANLNSRYSYLQLAGSYLAQKSGIPAANARAVQIRINGDNPAFATPQPGNVSSWQFGSYVHVEPLNGDWAGEHFPEDGGGNVYRASTGNHNADLSYGNTAGYFLNRGYSKTSNSSENDWSDLIQLTDVLNNTPNAQYAGAVRQVANVEKWMRYFAVMSMLTSLETSIATGRGDDYSMYRGLVDPRFLLLPHDLDTILGDGDTGSQPTAGLFRMMNGVVPVLNRFMSEPEFTPIYYRELLRMLDTSFSPEQFNPLLDQLLSDFVPQTDIDRLKAHQVLRNNYVRSQIPLALTATNTLARLNGYPRTTAPAVTLNGRANVLETRRVTVNGVAANWVVTSGAWTVTGIVLTPGVNRVVVRAFDVNDNEIERTFVDIWYDDGSAASVSGVLSGNTTWTAAGGPYQVTETVTVPAGVTLTIQPGTAVYFADGAGLEVGGSLIANGTDAQRIRFTRVPGSTGGWNGLIIDEASGESSISHADFEFVAGSGPNISVMGSTLFLDHVNWLNTTRTIISLSGASLSVRNSTFPTLTAAPHILGSFIPPGGFVVIEKNMFGGTTLLNDIINFRGAQRPGTVLQVNDNVFTSASDDVLDLDGTDAHIEGNVFLRVHKNNAVNGDTSSAIAAGRFAGYSPHIVAVRNLFFDVDHVALVKDGAALTLVNNTAVGIGVAAVNFTEPELNTLPGLRATLDGNIFFNPAGYSGTNFQNRLPTNGTVQLALARNLFSAEDGVVNGANDNFIADPRLENINTNTITAASIRRDFALRPGSPGIGTGPNGLDRGALVPAGASISGEPPSVTPATSASLTVGGPGISNYIYRVNGSPFSAEVPVTTPISLNGLANGSYTVEVIGRNSAGVQQDFGTPAVSKTWTVNTSLRSVVINEVLAWNTTFSINGQTPDLVELRNTGGALLDLGGMGLTDDPAEPYKFRIPEGTVILPGDYRLFYGDIGNDPTLYLGFGLSQEGDVLHLYDSIANGGGLLDSVAFGAQLPDLSIGRDDDATWNLNQPTLGGANVVQRVGDARALRINEWLANAFSAFGNDFVEIYNTDSLPVNLGGLYLTDEPGGAPMRHVIAPLTFVAPNGHIAFLADGDVDQGANHLSFKLSAEQGIIALLAPDLSVIDCVAYEPQLPDVSEGRRPSGGAIFGSFPSPTPGAGNPAVVVTPGTAILAINEVLANNGSLTNSDGTITDWVELFNGTTNTVDLSQMSLTDTVGTPRRWVFPSGVNLAPGASLIVRCDPDSPATLVNGPVLNTGFGLSASGDAAYLFDTPARSSALLDSVVFGLQASDYSIGRLPNGSGAWQLCVPTRGSQNLPAALGSVSAIRINEWLADPASGEDDWFELYNPGAQPVSLSGLILTDDPADRAKPPVPPLSFIGTSTNGFVQFIADSEPTRGANHADFKLDKDADSIVLYLPGNGPAIDQISFGLQRKEVSQGRFPDGGAAFVSFPGTESPGEANFLPLDQVVISEALTHTDPPYEDAIEVQNLSSEAIDISGWFLSDSRNDLKKFRIPDGTIVNAGGFAVFYEYQFNPEPGRGQSFSLSSSKGDQIQLSTADLGGNLTGYRATVKFDAGQNGVPFGRYETSTGPDFPALMPRTLGVEDPVDLAQFRTGQGLTNGAPVVGPVVIHEILYHPPDIGTNDNLLDEFIELRNRTAAPVALYDVNFPTNTWRLRDGVDFDFPQTTTLAASGYLLVVNFDPTNTAQLTAFRNKFSVPANVPIFGPYSGKLDNGSDSIELYRPDAPQLPPGDDAGFVPYILTDKVRYSDATPWPSLADGNTNGVGYSIQRRVASDYGNDPVNWLAGVPTPGNANGPAPITLPSITTQPQNQNAPETGTVTFTSAASGTAPLSYQWRFNGKPIPGATAPTLTLTNLHPANEGRYAVLVSNPAGAVSSAQARLSLQSPPVIVSQPQSRIVLAGSSADLSVTVIGTSPLRYQWRKDGVNLLNRTNATLSLVNIQSANEGAYTVVVTNIYGSTTSDVAQVTINTPPSITAQPQNVIVNAGDTANFSVGVSGSGPFQYEWRYEGVLLTGETNSTLVLNNVQGSSAGRYSVRIVNAVGETTSVMAVLTVVLPPVVTIAATDSSASEPGSNTGTFVVTRSYVTNSAVLVNLSIGGTAGNGVDYAALSSPVTIPAGQASATVSVAPIDDALLEFPETVMVTLAPGAGYTVGLQNNATVTIADNDNLAPTVAISAPPGGTLYPILPTNIVVSATASDPDGSVAKVEFYWQGTNKVGEATSAPYSINWLNASAGSNALTAVAYDNLDRATISAPVFLVFNAQPTAVITSPTNGATFTVTASIVINAAAADSDGSVTQVQFFADSTLLDTDVTAPFSTSWNDAAAGDYVLTARATDNRGAAQTSGGVTIRVRSPQPVLENFFAARMTVTEITNVATGSNVGAGKETGEPNHANDQGGASVWISWTAPMTGPAVADTLGSSFDTTLAVYTGTAVSALNEVASNNNIGGGGNNRSRVNFTAQAGATYHIAVDGNLTFQGLPTGSVQLNFGMTRVTSPPVITAQPQSVTAPRGTNVTFTVAANGLAPMSYQWRLDGVNLPNATTAALTLNNIQGYQEGNYSVVVTNPDGSATSGNARLTVNDGLFVVQRNTLIPMNATWKYDQTGTDYGATWRMLGFNDSAWLSGPALLGFEDTVPSPYFAPFSTALTPGSAGAPLVTYFRARFVFTNDITPALSLVATNFVDDGAVYYINGEEAGRLRMFPGVTNIFALASNVNPEGQTNVLTFPATNLVAGTNLLAVQVHQSSSFNADVAFGLSLTATASFTNYPALNGNLLGDGSFQVTLQGIAGRRYALDVAPTPAGAWTPLTTITNLTGQVTYRDGASLPAVPRFYRARWVP